MKKGNLLYCFYVKNLLIITQKVDQNEQLLGFFIKWITGFSGQFNKITVGCLEKGDYNLPSNVIVKSLGKDRNLSKIGQLFNFYKLIIGESKNYDVVFVHMNPIWVVLGGWWWRLSGKKISLWYAHGKVSLMLKMADKFTHLIFTSTKEGCRLDSAKIKVVGQGIDTDYFKPADTKHNDKFKIISVGRIALSKDYETLIEAINELPKDNIQVEIIGGIGLSEDEKYFMMLKNLVIENKLLDVIKFRGIILNRDLFPILQSADLFVNMGHTGSLDKAILEAMACGVIVLTCNEALTDVLGDYAKLLMYPKKDYVQLAEKIKMIMAMSQEEKDKISHVLRKIVVDNHNIHDLIRKISGSLGSNDK